MSLFSWILAAITFLLAASSCAQTEIIKFEQLHVGFNGPEIPGSSFYRDKASLEKSWVRRALSDQDFNKLISKVDFNRQVVIAFAVGERPRASGVVKINRITRFVGDPTPPIDISVLVGIVENGCAIGDPISYPFVLASFKIPENFAPYGGFEAQNFPDDCKKPKIAKPVN